MAYITSVEEKTKITKWQVNFTLTKRGHKAILCSTSL